MFNLIDLCLIWLIYGLIGLIYKYSSLLFFYQEQFLVLRADLNLN